MTRDFKEWVKERDTLKEFYGQQQMNRQQTGMMGRAMNMSAQASQGMNSSPTDNNKKIGWLLNTIQNMSGQNIDFLNQLIRSLMAMRKHLMQQSNPAASMNPQQQMPPSGM